MESRRRAAAALDPSLSRRIQDCARRRERGWGERRRGGRGQGGKGAKGQGAGVDREKWCGVLGKSRKMVAR